MPERRRYLAGLLFAVGLPTVPGTCVGQQPAVAPSFGPQIIARSQPLEPTTLLTTLALTPSLRVADDGLGGLPPLSIVQQAATIQRVSFSPLATPLQKIAPSLLSPTAIVPARPPVLSVEVLGPSEVEAGATARYEIVVRNPGSLELAGVRVEEPLPLGVKLGFVEPASEVQEGRLIWNLGNLEGNGERRLRLEMQPGSQPELLLVPTATFRAVAGLRTKLISQTLVTQPLANSTTFVLRLTAPTIVKRGSSVPLQVYLANQGATALTHVVVRAKLPPGIRHVAGRAIEANIGTLAAGQTKLLLLNVVATQTGSLVNEVTADADGGWQAQARTAVEVTDEVLGVKIEVPDRVTVSREVDIRLEVFNTGATPAVNLRLRQMVPDGFDVLEAGNAGTIDVQTRSVAWELGTLQAGQQQVVVIKVRSKFAGAWKWAAWLNADGWPEVKADRKTTIAAAN